MDKYQIAIDGPAASGKSTVAKILAERIHGFYISTGAMFRTLAWQLTEKKLNPKQDPDCIKNLLQHFDLHYVVTPQHTLQLTLNNVDVPDAPLRTPEVAKMASDIATLPEVRTFMKECQQKTADLGIVIMEGRDIGTVIFPQAKYKFFITASPLIRAQRRFAQGEFPPGATVESIAQEIAERDKQDENRAIAPLRPAEDAEIIMTDHYSIEEVVQYILNKINGTQNN